MISVHLSKELLSAYTWDLTVVRFSLE